MLLASDGSTTTLLQALLGEVLELRLDEVREGDGAEVPEATRAALRIDERTRVLIRRSALVTSVGVEVSRNKVVAIGAFDAAVDHALHGRYPIGRIMNNTRSGHRRILLDSGWSFWEAGKRSVRCAFKSYLIVEDGVSIHICERFNPRFLPVTAHG
ncbi:MAG: hypothetical protein ACRDTQ_14915 [Micromonosporaceae bacterium]